MTRDRPKSPLLPDAAVPADATPSMRSRVERQLATPREPQISEGDSSMSLRAARSVSGAILAAGPISGAPTSARTTSVSMPAARPSLGRIDLSGAVLQYPVELVVVAASTGGPAAVADFLQALPGRLPAPVVIVQHMARDFVGAFAERLNALTQLETRQARGGELISANQVWVAPGGSHLLVERFGRALRLQLGSGPPVNGCRPSADETLRSAVQAVGSKLLAVVLTGIGRDGRDGCRLVKQAGGQILVQDTGSALVSDMPEAVSKEQLAEGAFPPAELGQRVARKLAYGR